MQVEKILIVDDDPEDSEFFVAVMKQVDPSIKVHVAARQDELMHHLINHKPDILFIDAFIQHQSGFESIVELRSNKEYQDLPIIMYTGSADKRNIIQAFRAGASFYIVKPHSLNDVKRVLQYVVEKNWEHYLISQKQYFKDEAFFDWNEKE